jgi:DNA-directed RNA polymerase specialized sigma24 family protein
VNGQLPHEMSFPSTHWSLVGRVGLGGEADRLHALDQLIQRYLPAMRAHLAYAKRLPAQNVEDVLQAFIAEKVLAQNVVTRAEAARGRFRAFLLTSLNNFLASRRRDESRQKRGGGWRALADGDRLLEVVADDALGAADGPPADAFDVAWAREVLRQAIELMRAECESGGRASMWGVFCARVLDPIFEDVPPVPYPELVSRFGFASPAQASNALITANRHFMRVLRRVVGGYEQDQAAIEAELLDLRRIVSASRAGPA